MPFGSVWQICFLRLVEEKRSYKDLQVENNIFCKKNLTNFKTVMAEASVLGRDFDNIDI